MSDATITGPHPEYAPIEFGGEPKFTGHYRYRCEGCGIEAMRRRDVEYFCECGGDR